MAPRTSVLVVDDDPDAAALTADRLRDGLEDASVDVVHDTGTATSELEEATYDAVVSDYRIEDGDGLAFLETVRERAPTLPFVIFTGTGSERVASRAIGADVTDYVLKTDDRAAERLTDAVRTEVARRRAVDELDFDPTRRSLLVDQDLVGVVVIQDDRLQYVNDRFARIYGYEPEEVVGKLGPDDLVDEADRELIREKIRQRIEGEVEQVQYSFTGVQKDGTRREMEAFGGVIDYEGSPAVLGILLPQSADRRRERGLASLGDVTHDLMAASSRDRVLDVAVASTRSVLEREFGAVYRRRDSGAFEPVETTPAYDAVCGGDPPTLPGDGFLATVGDGTPVARFDDGDHLGDPFASGVAASLGRHGVFVVGAVEPNAFDDVRVDLTELLAGSIESAYDRTEHERRLAGLNEATEGLVRATHPELVAEIAVRTARDVLEFDLTSVHLRETDERGSYLRPVVATDARRELTDSLPELHPGEGLAWQAYETGEIIEVGDRQSEPAVDDRTTPLRSALVFPLGDHGTLTAGATVPDAFDEDDVELGRVLAATVAAALDRTEHDQQLEALVESTERLEAAETPESVADAAIETARDVLGHELCAIHVLDSGKLVPTAATNATRSLLGELPPLDDDSLAWQAYETGDVLRFDDVREAGPANPDTPVRSELLVPLADQGVFIVSATVPGAFDRTDVRLAELLGASVRAAMERASREATVARQNEQLEEFASVVSHDLRNPLGVAMGRLDIAMESCDDSSLPIVEQSLDRMETLIDDLLTLARQGQTVGETDPVSLAPLVRDVWRSQDAPDATLVVDDELPTVDGDANRIRQLFENLFGNALRHVGEGVTVTVGPCDRGFYVADDGPGIPPDKREKVLEGGYTTSREGTGFGLAIVRSIAGAHGWSVRITESAEGGARIEFTR